MSSVWICVAFRRRRAPNLWRRPSFCGRHVASILRGLGCFGGCFCFALAAMFGGGFATDARAGPHFFWAFVLRFELVIETAGIVVGFAETGDGVCGGFIHWCAPLCT